MGQKYYHFNINLNSPYKWGGGYEGVDSLTISLHEKTLAEAMNYIGFEKYEEKQCYGSCPSYYNKVNKFEEIYLHPMQISGTMTEETVSKIIEYFENKNTIYPNTIINNIHRGTEEKQYTYQEVIEFYNSLNEKDLINLYKKHYGRLAMNYNFKELGMNFKEYCFVKLINNDIKLQKDFLINTINERFKTYREQGLKY